MRRAVRVVLIFLTVLLLSASAAAVAGAVWLARYAAAVEPVALPVPPVRCEGMPSTLYAAAPDGTWFVTAETPTPPAQSVVWVTLGEMPAYLPDAFAAVEDKRFYRHGGVDLLRTARAVCGYLTGSGGGGGSTITQQLVKNLTGDTRRTPDRKLTELFRAIDLEKRADKETIMEAYLNVIGFGPGPAGVGAAAERLFGKQAGELTLAECACLTALANSPVRYDPVAHPEANAARRETVLSLMAEQGYITAAERDEAVRAGISLRADTAGDAGGETDTAHPAGVSSWYTDTVLSDVIRDLCARYGMTRAQASETVFGGGLRIYTCMEPALQTAVEDYYRDPSHFPAGTNGRPQSGCIVIDPSDGHVLAVAGAVGEKQGNRVQSFATDTRRPAGSAVKPLSVFAPAVEEGLITWSARLDDSPVTRDGDTPWPRNADGQYLGTVTAADALALSRNPPAVRLAERVGCRASLAFLREKLGLTDLVPPSDRSEGDATAVPLALGQFLQGVTLRDLTAAYTALLNGVRYEPVSYTRVLDRDGNILLENDCAGEIVLSRETAALMTAMLERVLTVGTAAESSFTADTGIPAAGKTGTTQNNCDRWFVGYTPDLLCGVWTGYEWPRPLDGIRGNPSLSVWQDVMETAERLRGRTERHPAFPQPSDIIRVTVCRESGLLPCPACLGADLLTEGVFLRGTEPHEVCPGHTAAADAVISEPPGA